MATISNKEIIFLIDNALDGIDYSLVETIAYDYKIVINDTFLPSCALQKLVKLISLGVIFSISSKSGQLFVNFLFLKE